MCGISDIGHLNVMTSKLYTHKVFVKVPGIVDLVRNRRDPDFYAEPRDLYDEQKGDFLARFGGMKRMKRVSTVFRCR